MSEVAHAPWRLRGECVLGWVRPPLQLRSLLPAGVSALPGPAAVVAVRYTESPVGPYLELAVGIPARLGLRPGLCVVVQLVSCADARLGYRQNWGMPASLGSLRWWEEGEVRVLRCDGPAIEVRGNPVGPAFPALVPIRSVQRRVDGPVVLPRRFLALTRLARTDVWVEPTAGEEFAPLGGRHPGAVMSGIRVLARPARHPAGILSSLRAPLRAIEPATAGGAGLR